MDFEGTVIEATRQKPSGWCSVLLDSMPEGISRIYGIFPEGIKPIDSYVKGSGLAINKGIYGRQLQVDPMTVSVSLSSDPPAVFEGNVVSMAGQKEDGWTILTLDSGKTVVGEFPFQLDKGRFVTGVGFVLKDGPYKGYIRVLESKKGETIKQSDGTVQIKLEDPYQNAIKNYLVKHVRGIGDVRATDIVKTFRDKTLDVLKDTPEKLLDIKGITQKELDSLEEFKKTLTWTKDRDVLIWLNQYGIGFGDAQKICDMYGDEAPIVVKDNPYILAEDIDGIAFHTADRIATDLGLEKTSPYRIACGIKACLTAAATKGHYPSEILKQLGTDTLPKWVNSIGAGHTRLDENELINLTASKLYLDVDPALVKQILHEKVEGVGMQYVKEKDPVTGVEKTKSYVGLSSFQIAEVSIAKDLVRLMKSYTPRPADDFLPLSEGLEPDQAKAVRLARENGVFALTGLPGTGKTFTVKEIIAAEDPDNTILVAPTGKAAQRLAQMTGRPASTIHRALECRPDENGAFHFLINRSCPFDKSLVVIDETSMMDTMLMKNLLAAIPDGARVVLVGDRNQLPSVAAGKVLQDILSSGLVPSVHLTKIKRQAGDGSINIVKCAAAVNAGDFEAAKASLSPLPENASGTKKKPMKGIFFVPAPTQGAVMETIGNLVDKTIPAMGYSKDDVQVLCPKKAHMCGVKTANALLQEIVNPNGEVVEKKKSMSFRKGDRVMQTSNDYTKFVFNGETGVITGVSKSEKGDCLEIEFNGKKIPFTPAETNDLELSYAMTIHKSQGNQYPATVISLHDEAAFMLQRNLLYTAMTRAEGLCIIVGTETALQRAINNVEHRNTGLRDRILAQMKKAVTLETTKEAPKKTSVRKPDPMVPPPAEAPVLPRPEIAVSWQDMKLLESYGVTEAALRELGETGRTHFVGLTSYRPSTPESPVPAALRIIKTNCFLVNVDGKVQVENARGKSYGGIREYFEGNQTNRCASVSKKKDMQTVSNEAKQKLK